MYYQSVLQCSISLSLSLLQFSSFYLFRVAANDDDDDADADADADIPFSHFSFESDIIFIKTFLCPDIVMGEHPLPRLYLRLTQILVPTLF